MSEDFFDWLTAKGEEFPCPSCGGPVWDPGISYTAGYCGKCGIFFHKFSRLYANTSPTMEGATADSEPKSSDMANG